MRSPLAEDGKLVVAKTGMGSSAAMITSLVGCLLAHFEVVNLPTKDCHEMDIASLDVVHKLAQVCHASAQGKVGSGFDVSAAVYGSHTYTRFSPSVIDQVLGCEHSSPNLPRAVQSVVLSSSWDCSRDVLMLPHCFRLLMGDVQGGSSTPSMARSVLAWRNSGGDEPNRVWSELSQVNLEIARLMGDIAGAAGVEDESRRLAQVLPNQWRESACSIEEALLFRLRRLFLTARHLLRTIGTGAGVPIEPNSQTQLADASMELPGVLCAGVPGAGGEDAVFAIVVHPTAVDALEALWCSWKGGR
jgi:phosphomevalonate kinase